ncbi:MAG TPA: O-methyltransferase [Gemmatimonadales bacterium]|nr:O-methyltransferase [Gemmatimonadales bacterium]
MQDTWSRVDQYVAGLMSLSDPILEAALAASAEAGLPPIAVSPAQGQFLALLVQALGARRVLELGTLGGYSTIWMGRALPPGGHLLSLELDPAHAAVARANLARAGLADVVTVQVGRASDTLRHLADAGDAPFDLVFIDADKEGYPEYLELVLPLVRTGSLIVADNVVRGGAVADAGSADPNVRAVRRYLELVAVHPRLSATVLQTVGSKGYDGLALAVVV